MCAGHGAAVRGSTGCCSCTCRQLTSMRLQGQGRGGSPGTGPAGLPAEHAAPAGWRPGGPAAKHLIWSASRTCLDNMEAAGAAGAALLRSPASTTTAAASKSRASSSRAAVLYCSRGLQAHLPGGEVHKAHAAVPCVHRLAADAGVQHLRSRGCHGESAHCASVNDEASEAELGAVMQPAPWPTRHAGADAGQVLGRRRCRRLS